MQTPFKTREDALAASAGLADRAERLVREANSRDNNAADRTAGLAHAQVIATLAQTAATAAVALPSESAIQMVGIDPGFFDPARVRYTPADDPATGTAL